MREQLQEGGGTRGRKSWNLSRPSAPTSRKDKLKMVLHIYRPVLGTTDTDVVTKGHWASVLGLGRESKMSRHLEDTESDLLQLSSLAASAPSTWSWLSIGPITHTHLRSVSLASSIFSLFICIMLLLPSCFSPFFFSFPFLTSLSLIPFPSVMGSRHC